MGSFSYTCCVSGLPIHYDDPVRFILLAKNPDSVEHKWTCGVDGRWQLVTIPVMARYNDYGSVHEFAVTAAKFCLFDFLRKQSIPRPEGENPYHDVPVVSWLSEKEWLTALWEGRVQVRKWHRKVPVAQSMIREDVWKCLVHLECDSVWDTTPVHSLKWWQNLVSECECLDLGLIGSLTTDLRRYWRAPAVRTHLAEVFRVEEVLSVLGYQWVPKYAAGPQFGEFDLHSKFNEQVAEIAKGIFQRQRAELEG